MSNDLIVSMIQGMYPGGPIPSGGPFAASASSYYPQYAPYPPPPSAGHPGHGVPSQGPYGQSPFGAGPGPLGPSPFGPQVGGPFSQAAYPGPFSGGLSPAAASSYPQYAPVPSGHGYGQQSPDFHSVLDGLVRHAGLSPMGAHDQDMSSSSTITSKGDTPVFSFKKLYSFPFYLSSDNRSPDGMNLQIPYMKQHIRRMNTAPMIPEMSDLSAVSSRIVKSPRTAVYYRPDNMPPHHGPVPHGPASIPLHITKKMEQEIFDRHHRIPVQSPRGFNNFYHQKPSQQHHFHREPVMEQPNIGMDSEYLQSKVNQDMIRDQVLEMLSKKMNNDIVREQIMEMLTRKLNNIGSDKDSDKDSSEYESLSGSSGSSGPSKISQSLDGADQMETESRQKATYLPPPSDFNQRVN